MPIDINALLADRSGEKYDLYDRHLNSQMVKVLKTIGFDRGYVRGNGAYLYDRDDNRYLDLLSGFGVFAVGRNHPAVIGALKQVLDAELPNLVQMDVSLLSGLLAERLLPKLRGLDKMFFCNSGAEAVEAAMKIVPYFLHSAAAPGRTSSVGMLTPLPWIGSTMKAATSRRRNAPSSAVRSLKGTAAQSPRSGSKPFLKISSPFSESEPKVRPWKACSQDRILERLVAARANLIAASTVSAPELAKNTLSRYGTCSNKRSASTPASVDTSS